jgi:endonuclease/exonuclease/phosphatase (EEP) superfamily protein YafD
LPHRLGIAATAIGAFGLVLAWLLALVPTWPFSLFEHFRVQYAGAGIVIVAVSAAFRMRGWFDAAAMATIGHLLWLVPDLCTRPHPIPPGGIPLRVLLLNVHTSSSSFADVRKLIDDVRPDVLGLVEVDQRWLDGVAASVAGYQGRLEKPRDDNFGVALYTRMPLTGAVEELGGTTPSAVGAIAVGDAPLEIIVVHPIPPVSGAAFDEQRRVLDAVAERVHSLPRPVVVIGDFNATPWSGPFRRFARATGLCDSRAGFGIQASFPAASALLRIPIDHMLASCSIGIADRRIERDVGSDHLPVVIDIVVPRRAN